jgi:hypothetical protein
VFAANPVLTFFRNALSTGVGNSYCLFRAGPTWRQWDNTPRRPGRRNSAPLGAKSDTVRISQKQRPKPNPTSAATSLPNLASPCCRLLVRRQDRPRKLTCNALALGGKAGHGKALKSWWMERACPDKRTVAEGAAPEGRPVGYFLVARTGSGIKETPAGRPVGVVISGAM